MLEAGIKGQHTIIVEKENTAAVMKSGTAVALHLCCSGTAKTMHWFCSEYLVSLTLAPKALQRSRARFHHITPCPENSQPKSGEQKG